MKHIKSSMKDTIMRDRRERSEPRVSRGSTAKFEIQEAASGQRFATEVPEGQLNQSLHAHLLVPFISKFCRQRGISERHTLCTGVEVNGVGAGVWPVAGQWLVDVM